MPNMTQAKKPAVKKFTRPTLEEHKTAEYRRMGFTIKQAKALTKIHGLYAGDVREKYINRGCSPKLAFDILSD